MNDLKALIEPGQTPIRCDRCEKLVEPFLSRSAQHIKATCPDCEKHLGFLRQKNVDRSFQGTIMNLARRMTPTERRQIAHEILSLDTSQPLAQ